MIFTQEQLEDIQRDGMLGKSLIEVSIRLKIPYQELYRSYSDPNSHVKAFYDYGISKGKIVTDDILFKLAENGSISAKTAYDTKMNLAFYTNLFSEIDNS